MQQFNSRDTDLEIADEFGQEFIQKNPEIERV